MLQLMAAVLCRSCSQARGSHHLKLSCSAVHSSWSTTHPSQSTPAKAGLDAAHGHLGLLGHCGPGTLLLEAGLAERPLLQQNLELLPHEILDCVLGQHHDLHMWSRASQPQHS